MQSTYWSIWLPNRNSNQKNKAVVGKNENLLVANHDFSRLFFIPDANLLHNIPDSENGDEVATEQSCEDFEFGKKTRLGG